jgi:hypothetical protein
MYLISSGFLKRFDYRQDLNLLSCSATRRSLGDSLMQGCVSVFIFYGSGTGSGTGSSILGWPPIRIRIQSGSGAFMTKNWKKNYSWNFYFIFFLSKTAIYLSLGLHKVCPSYRRSLQLSKEAIQHFKTWAFANFFYFCGSFLPFWIRIPNPDPDPQTRLNPDPIRIRNPALMDVTLRNRIYLVLAVRDDSCENSL